MNSSEKSRKKRIIILGAAAIAALVIIAAGRGGLKANSAAKLFGIGQTTMLPAGDGKEIVAIIDGENITQKGFDTYKLFLNSNGENKLSDKQVLDKIIERQVICNQAVEEGMTASESEIDSAVRSARETMKSDSKTYAAFKEYVAGLNLTEDSYWESVRPVYKKALTCGKYKNSLKAKFREDNKGKAISDLNAEFSKYYDGKVKALVKNAKVESLLK
ncbi:SurA N-terminal domain-containing protein [Ruminiclostridium hungatei]|nr:SurA N-terminal domain-containing protein [Ruminiclostridium hungatei]